MTKSKYKTYVVFVDRKRIGKVDGTSEQNAEENARSKFRIERSSFVSVVWIHTGKIDGSH